MNKLIVVLVAVLSLSGCQTPGETKGQRMRALMDECVAQVTSTPDAQIVQAQIISLRSNAPNLFELMASKAKLDETQKNTFKRFLADNARCRQISDSALYGSSYHATQIRYYGIMDAIYFKLLNDEITVGEANIAREQAVIQNKLEIASISNRLNQQQEAQRQQAASMLLPYMMMQQQNTYTQQLNNTRPVYVPPVYTPPVNTNCTTFGNQVQCTSR